MIQDLVKELKGFTQKPSIQFVVEYVFLSLWKEVEFYETSFQEVANFPNRQVLLTDGTWHPFLFSILRSNEMIILRDGGKQRIRKSAIHKIIVSKIEGLDPQEHYPKMQEPTLSPIG